MTTFPFSPRRMGLDQLVWKLLDPAFALCFRRTPVAVERPGHASPTVLANSGSRSAYVKRWRRHARRCAECRTMFQYFGLRVD